MYNVSFFICLLPSSAGIVGQSQGAGVSAAETKMATALSLLDRATATANGADTFERSVIFYNAAEVAAALAPQRANAWSRQAFDLAQQTQPVWNRLAMEKNALRVLAINDPDTALAFVSPTGFSTTVGETG